MTFKDYLADCRAGSDAQGDVVRLAREDAALSGASSWEELADHLGRRGDFTVVEAGRGVWDAFQAKLREQARRAKRG